MPLNQVKSRRGSTRKPRDEQWIGSVLNRAARRANKRLELTEQVPSGRYVRQPPLVKCHVALIETIN